MFERDWTTCSKYDDHYRFNTMTEENRPLVTYGAVEFEKQPVEVQDF